MKEEIKSCPFCGSIEAEPWLDDYGSVVVFCHHCETTGPHGTTRTQAIERWNKRAEAELDNYKDAIQSICDKFETYFECRECPIQEYGVCPDG